ncbi:MAG: hydroxyethylthiazole kinase [Vallitalea sp.]|jgi:hydroxyethylthiazole kinase|nr:hydroxyethylthiazole kinase [Vallitalea sp.]
MNKLDFNNITHNIIEDSNKPLIHFITNYVTINDVANMTLAFGGSPIMAEAFEEVEEITSNCACLVINIGMLTTNKIKSMRKAIKVANHINIPVILDPVGVASSKFRLDFVLEILNNYKVDIVKGNISEMKALLGYKTLAKGVDCEEVVNDNIDIIGTLVAQKFDTVASITGNIDTVCNNKYIAKIEGGSSMLTYITGIGCMINPLIAVSLARCCDPFISSVYGIVAMNVAADYVEKNLDANEGVGTYKIRLLDTIYNIKKENLIHRGKVNIYEV